MPNVKELGDQGVTIKLSTILVAAVFFFAGFFVGQRWEGKLGGSTSTGTNTGTTVTQPTADAGAGAAMNYDALPEVTDSDFLRGNKNAKVILVEYSDLECPFCARFHPTMQQVMTEYGDKVAWVYRHYPLSFHPNAQKAAEGADCVADQLGNDGFWKYADALFEYNTANGSISAQAIADAATTAGANADTWKSCLDSGEKATDVNAAMTGGSAAGVNGTPGTFVVVDGKAVDFIGGALPYESVKATIDTYINS